MSVDFKLKDFAYPFEIIRLKTFLEKSQWFSAQKLREYQSLRLKTILTHCYNHVPYYRNLFDSLKLKPDDFKDLSDLQKLPYLTKSIIRNNFRDLTARNAGNYSPFLCRTSGTTGEPVEFYLDKPSNILEFCYYWRYWAWAGYKLGMPFAEFSIHHFLNTNMSDIFRYFPLTNRLVLNPAQLSYYNINTFIKAIKKYRVRFLKGSPSAISIFSILLKKYGHRGFRFKAVFTTGEKLINSQRQKIMKILNCKITDSYGHMERTVAVSQCPEGKYHVHSEYGILDIESKEKIMDADGNEVGEIIGTSLHNFAMPLLRYRTGDLASVNPVAEKCPCGRELPLVKDIFGRVQDVIVAPDERLIANVFVIFNFITGVLWYQFVQEDKKNILLKIVKSEDAAEDKLKETIQDYLKKILGKEVCIKFVFLPLKDIPAAHKHKTVESMIKTENID